ncbi:MAG: FAD-dependent oxidoreductase [Maricaulaceae bacterium]
MVKHAPLYDYDALIIGGGIVGLTMALTSAHHGLKVALIDRNDFSKPSRDGRAYALSASSLNLFDHLGIEALRAAAEPMVDMKVEEAKRGQAPSPFKLSFAADKQSDEQSAPLAFMLEAKILTRALQDRIKTSSNITVMSQATAAGLKQTAGFAEITLETGQALRAPLVIAADGGPSRIRQWAGIGVRRDDYNQSVVVTNVQFEKPHGGVSRQIFYNGQPFALLPMTGNRAQVPWFDTHNAIKAALALSEDDFVQEISHRFHGNYGNISLLSPRYSYPVALQVADSYTAPRVALIGDAAHQISPLIGQGLNLGLRDAASLAAVLHEAKQTGQDLGGPILGDYANWRGIDGRALAMTTDMLTKLYAIQRGPLAHLRRLGVGAVNKSNPLKSLLALEATGTTGTVPPLLQPL